MINSFGTEADGEATEADGSGRGTGKRRQLFGLFGLFGRRRLSSPAWPAASGAKPPTAAGASSLSFSCSVVLRLSPSATAAGSHPTDDGKIHRCGGCAGGCAGRSSAARALLPRMASGERSEAPTAAGATAELNFKVLSIVNNKFVN